MRERERKRKRERGKVRERETDRETERDRQRDNTLQYANEISFRQSTFLICRISNLCKSMEPASFSTASFSTLYSLIRFPAMAIADLPLIGCPASDYGNRYLLKNQPKMDEEEDWSSAVRGNHGQSACELKRRY